MNNLWLKLKASGLVAVCWIMGLICLWMVVNNALSLSSGEVMTKTGFVGVGLVLNTLALFDRRRLWIGLMAPLYLFGISAGMFYQETFHLEVAFVFVALMILIPITYYSIPKAPKS